MPRLTNFTLRGLLVETRIPGHAGDAKFRVEGRGEGAIKRSNTLYIFQEKCAIFIGARKNYERVRSGFVECDLGLS